jgi:hypothetical protein
MIGFAAAPGPVKSEASLQLNLKFVFSAALFSPLGQLKERCFAGMDYRGV